MCNSTESCVGLRVSGCLLYLQSSVLPQHWLRSNLKYPFSVPLLKQRNTFIPRFVCPHAHCFYICLLFPLLHIQPPLIPQFSYRFNIAQYTCKDVSPSLDVPVTPFAAQTEFLPKSLSSCLRNPVMSGIHPVYSARLVSHVRL